MSLRRVPECVETNQVTQTSSAMPNRRQCLAGAAALALTTVVRPAAGTPTSSARIDLDAGKTKLSMLGAKWPRTDVWAYNGQIPGPLIRLRQHERLRIRVANRLDEETTVHWHGLRIPNAMDGVPHLTQKPIAPGQDFHYDFMVPDAGTYWYHPHQRSFEQVGRGLYGALIVDEAEPIRVDRELIWTLDDWRLTKTGQISDNFGHQHDAAHGGRLGNAVTVNGRLAGDVALRRGERIRLRLINAANARIFGLEFQNHRPIVIALDGQPVEPHAPDGDLVVLGPAMRADLILDASASNGRRFAVTDRFYNGLEYKLLDLVYDSDPLRQDVPDWPMDLPANPLPEPDLTTAERHEIMFQGGMMGGMVMRDMDIRVKPDQMQAMQRMMHDGKVWFVNGIAAEGHVMDPMLTLQRGRSYLLAMTNATAWHHPIHLHGHSFRVIARNGTPTRRREWQDTVLMAPREKVEIAFVADNPGDWMFHCHILEHQAGGMMGVIRVGNERRRT